MAQVFATENATTITITTEYKTQEIWNALVGSDFANTNHWIKSISCGDTPAPIKITYIEKTTGDYVNGVIQPTDIYTAFAQLVKENTTHCGGYSIQDFDDQDSCFADFVLQQALYGEIVFG